MKIKDLLQSLQNGLRPVVEFREGIHDKESYAEPKMRARIISCPNPDRDDVVRIMFDFAEFDAHNKAFESNNYYDKQGNPTLTAREAGFYKAQDHMYFDSDEDVERHMVFLDDNRQALYERFSKSGSTDSYVSWLEQQVLAASKS